MAMVRQILIKEREMNVKNMAENIQELCANGASQSDLIQILTDPENQPSQYGTVPLIWYENLENRIERIRFMVGEVVDELDGTYEKHAIRKLLQEALDA